nr:MAG TPA: hypothetical protein [Caudoviricetes sp.]
MLRIIYYPFCISINCSFLYNAGINKESGKKPPTLLSPAY